MTELVVEVIIRNEKRYDIVKIKLTESDTDSAYDSAYDDLVKTILLESEAEGEE